MIYKHNKVYQELTEFEMENKKAGNPDEINKLKMKISEKKSELTELQKIMNARQQGVMKETLKETKNNVAYLIFSSLYIFQDRLNASRIILPAEKGIEI